LAAAGAGYAGFGAAGQWRLWQRYYPEGGWGWAVVTVSALVNILNHGLQLSFGVLIGPAAFKFMVPEVVNSGISFRDRQALL
jgi:hypothetical protein